MRGYQDGVVFISSSSRQMRITGYVTRYCSLRDVGKSTEEIYSKHARGFERDLGPMDIADVTVEILARHLRKLKQDGHKDSYRRARRNHIVALLRGAAKDETLERRPPRIYRDDVPIVRIRDYIPCGFRLNEIMALLVAADGLKGNYRNGIPRRWFWRAIIRTGWESGLAPCDLLALSRRAIAADGSCQALRQKTGERHSFRLRPRTIEALDKLGKADRERCFPLWASTEMLRREFRKLRLAAGLSAGSMKWLRSGSGSEVEQQQIGAGHIHLANSQAVFDQHYRVPSIVIPDIPMPRDPES